MTLYDTQWRRVPPPPLTTRLLIHAISALRGKTGEVPEFVDIGRECFAGKFKSGRVVICYQGENYVKQRLTLRSRLHNRLVRRLNLRWPEGVGQ